MRHDRIPHPRPLSLLSAINAGNTGTNRPHQAKFSTTGRHTFAGQVKPSALEMPADEDAGWAAPMRRASAKSPPFGAQAKAIQKTRQCRQFERSPFRMADRHAGISSGGRRYLCGASPLVKV
jgi:hypothetical protein